MGEYQHAEQKTYTVRPPKVEASVSQVLARWRKKGGTSNHIPHSMSEAVNFWLNRQEKRTERDIDEPTYDNKGNQVGWSQPHAERIAYNLNMFLKQSEPNKAFIVNNIENGTPYRGDDINFYKEVCAQSDIMSRNPAEYIQNAGNLLKAYKGAI